MSSRKKTKINDVNATPTEQKLEKANLETAILEKTTENDVEAPNGRRGETTTKGETDLIEIIGIKIGRAEVAMKKVVEKKMVEKMVVVTRNVEMIETIEKKNQFFKKCPEQNKWTGEISMKKRSSG